MIDVVVVGGGPAGSAAAVTCARAGLETALFEKDGPVLWASRAQDDPEESIGPEAVSLLQALGVDCAASATPFAGIAVDRRMTVFGPTTPVAGFHVRRSWLDQALRAVASRAGAIISIGTEVLSLEQADAGCFRVVTPAGPVQCRHLIDASGRRLWLARRLGLSRRRMSPPLIAWRDVISSKEVRTGVLARFVPHPDGWTWLAEVSPVRTVRIQLRPARDTLRRTENAAPTPRAATWHAVRQLAGSRWWIAGDAAASLDPASGSGIAFALRSGLAAGSAVAASDGNASAAAIIAAQYHDTLSRDFEWRATVLARRYRQLGIGILD